MTLYADCSRCQNAFQFVIPEGCKSFRVPHVCPSCEGVPVERAPKDKPRPKGCQKPGCGAELKTDEEREALICSRCVKRAEECAYCGTGKRGELLCYDCADRYPTCRMDCGRPAPEDAPYCVVCQKQMGIAKGFKPTEIPAPDARADIPPGQPGALTGPPLNSTPPAWAV